VVDDNALVRGIVGNALVELGHHAILAGSATEAIESSRGVRPSCALVDLVMPGDGCVGAVRGLCELHPGLPIVIMSGYAQSDAAARLGALDVAHFLGKPFTLAELEDKLAAIQARP
jgi:two-component system cell cycle sensor histidine kinase/response regulator CckA